jgi:hypothetical protein
MPDAGIVDVPTARTFPLWIRLTSFMTRDSVVRRRLVQLARAGKRPNHANKVVSAHPGRPQPVTERVQPLCTGVASWRNSKVWLVSDYQTGTSDSGWNTAIGCGTAAGYGCSQYQYFAPSQTSTSIQPDIALNAQRQPVHLSHVTVRYWVTRDGRASTFDATCQYAQAGCSNVTCCAR